MKSNTADGEGESGDAPGYVLTSEDLRLREVYRYWVHGNRGTHLDSGIAEDRTWQGWWHDLAIMPSRRYKAPCGKVGRRYVNVLVRDLRGVLDRRWNLERFNVFQMATLQRARHVTASRDIRRRIEKRLDTWEAENHAMLVDDTLRSCTQYLTAFRSFLRSTRLLNVLALCSAVSSRRTAVRYCVQDLSVSSTSIA